MQVKIVSGERQIQANGRDLKLMREAAGLFAFVLDNVPADELLEFVECDSLPQTSPLDAGDVLAELPAWLQAAILACEGQGDGEQEDPTSDDPRGAAGQTT